MLLAALFILSQIQTSRKTGVDQNPARGWMIKLVREHPDPVISKQLHEEWSRSEIAILSSKLDANVVGTLSFYEPELSERVFGVRPKTGQMPVLELDESFLESAQRDPAVRVQLMKTLRHEYEHYLQWRSGTAFHNNYAPDSKENCVEIWEREYPVYLADCRRWQRWWAEFPMSPVMANRCQYSDDPRYFQLVLAHQLATKAPKCMPVWQERLHLPTDGNTF